MQIKPQDLFISTYHITIGGFSMPKVGVSVLHVPTGIEVKSSSERSQHANKQKAFDNIVELCKALPEQLELDL